MYRQFLLDSDHPVWANVHWRGVESVGGCAWRANWAKMQARGWYTYASFIADPRKSLV